MLINADYSRPASLEPHQHRWVASPQPGVETVMLDRIGGERARATSLVRYQPGSQFPGHEHPGGEEILVLSGTFSEDGQHHPAGCYLRNPPGSKHCPSSHEGALIFVKLGQMGEQEFRPTRIDTRQLSAWRRQDGVDICPLFADAREQVSLQRLAPGAAPLAPGGDGLGTRLRRRQLVAPATGRRRPAPRRCCGREPLSEEHSNAPLAACCRRQHMRSTRIAIVGGGLSGLYAARLLQQRGVHDYLLLEARPQLGGRIAAVADGFDLGPTWYWPEQQAELARLIDELGLKAFPQFDEGAMVVERSTQQPPARMPGFSSSPASMRLQGGMASLIGALHRGLDPRRLRVGQRVRRIVLQGAQLELEIEGPSGEIEGLGAEHVLLALPPRLGTASIDFNPALPAGLARNWRDTPTWMAPHAKYLAVYDRPFWREQGLSGEARSAHGPLGEIHDASMPEGSAALFGFFGIPAQVRRTVADEQLRLHCRAQLTRLFGPEAASPRFDQIKDWATESFTSTDADAASTGHAGWVPGSGATEGVWQGRLTGIASEWSTQFPGYLAGAIDAARHGIETWLADQSIERIRT